MAKLKYKNGSSWTEFPLGIGGTLNQQYPVGSFYYSPVAVAADETSTSDNLNYSWDIFSADSPALIYGGSWTEIKIDPTATVGRSAISVASGGPFRDYNTKVCGFLTPPTTRSIDSGVNLNTNFLIYGNSRNVMTPGDEQFKYGLTYSTNSSSDRFQAGSVPYWVKKYSSSNSNCFFFCRIWQRIA